MCFGLFFDYQVLVSRSLKLFDSAIVLTVLYISLYSASVVMLENFELIMSRSFSLVYGVIIFVLALNDLHINMD